MIYINGEAAKKDEQLMNDLKKIYRENLSSDGLRIEKPVVIKYTDDLITWIVDEKGRKKKQQPRSLALYYVVTAPTRGEYGGEHAEIRYSPVNPIINTKGEKNFRINQLEITGGRDSINDIDLLYFFEFFSEQNAARHSGPKAKLQIENKEKEAAALKAEKQLNLMYEKRLWGEAIDGGASDEKIREFCKLHIQYVDLNKSVDILRQEIEMFVKVDRFGKDKFVNFVNHKLESTEKGEKRSLIAEAQKLEIVHKNDSKKKYTIYIDGDEEGVFEWDKYPQAGAPDVKFFHWLTNDKPELLAKIEQAVAMASSVAAN